MNNHNLRRGNPTGGLNKKKFAALEAMAHFGERVKNKLEESIETALNDPDSKTYLRACELILKYTCPLPKDSSEKETSPLNQVLLEKLCELQEENRRLKSQ